MYLRSGTDNLDNISLNRLGDESKIPSPKGFRLEAFFPLTSIVDLPYFTREYLRLGPLILPAGRQVTSLIPHHRPDWIFPAGLFCSVVKREDRKRKQGSGLHSKD